jgi:hypothetical protein
MTHTKTILILFVSSLILGAIGYFFIFPEKINLCPIAYQYVNGCLSPYARTLGEPLFATFRFLALGFLFLLAVPDSFTLWKKCARWFIPLGTLLIILAPVYSGIADLTPTKEMLSWFLGWLYLALTLLIIGITTFRNRKG